MKPYIHNHAFLFLLYQLTKTALVVQDIYEVVKIIEYSIAQRTSILQCKVYWLLYLLEDAQ